MPRFGPQLAFTTIALIGALIGGSQAVQAGNDSEEKGAKIYCFMRSSGNDHSVSWNAAYAVIKRQGGQLFKTSPEHASVMITEAVGLVQAGCVLAAKILEILLVLVTTAA